MEGEKKGIFGGGKAATPEAPKTEAVPQNQVPGAVPADPEKIKAQKKAAADRLKDRKTTALNTLIDMAKRLGNDEEKAAAAYLEPGRHISGAGSTGPKAPKVKKDFFAELFATTDTVHEDEVYLKHKLGRQEMGALIKAAVNTEPAQRRWVKFDTGTGQYIQVAKGETAPDGWLGAMPKAPKVL